jgi:hypothetical protein
MTKSKSEAKRINAQVAGEGAVEAAVIAPINEAKVKELILRMAPEVKGENLQNVIVNLLTEYDRLKRSANETKTETTIQSDTQVLEGIKRIEASLSQVKEQFSIMRQYGVGAVAGR